MKINVNTFNKNLLKIQNPIKTKIGYNATLKYGDEDFTFQMPICKIVEIDHEKYYKIQIPYRNTKHYEFMNNVEEKVINFVYEMSPFISTLDNDILNIKMNPKTLIFDTNKNQITKYELNVGDKIICIVDTKGIWIDDVSCTLRWNSLEIMKMKST